MEIDYEKLGLKCGLEIHQQLDTSKLFCNCPSLLRQDEPGFVVKRKLHAVAGESGAVDEAAAYEVSREKEFVYEGYDTTCLLELDEEPPHVINKEALEIALQIALLLNCKLFPITQIMRKTVLDGSNTGGFQRTVLIARDGWISVGDGKVGIDTVCLEEDSARIIDKKERISVYRLDRLGIPLVEIATAPDIKTPEQAKEVALHIGNILRSCKVKRGIGTIRQDINISIKPGKERSKRVELKGFQDPKIMVKTVENEAKRQKEFLEKGEMNKSEVRNVLPDATSEFLRPMPGAARMYPETDLPILRISRDMINEAKKNLPELRTDIEKELSGKGLNPDMIKLLFKQNKMEEFKELLNIVNNPSLIVKIMLMYPKEIASKNKISLEEVENRLTNDVLSEILVNLKKAKINENEIKGIIEKIAEGKNISEILSAEKIDMNSVEDRIRKIIKEKPGLSEHAYMGIIMNEFKGKANGKEVMEIIKRYIK
ncbi:MAG: Glu-tRNA(Gln) amidotransferase subunit GatE [Nanoarchaeota archaeon]